MIYYKYLYLFAEFVAKMDEEEGDQVFGQSLLIDAVRRENVDDVKWLTTYIGCSVNDRSDDGSTSLGTAIVQENLDIVCILIEKGADANNTYPVETEDGTVFEMSPLIEALELENSDIVSFLIVQGCAQLNVKNYQGASRLHIAVYNSMEDIVEKLLECDICIDGKDNEGATPLIIAAQEGDSKLLKKLIGKNAKIDEKDLSGSTALMVAVETYLKEDESEEMRKCVDILLEGNADVNATDNKNNNVLMQCDEEWCEDNEELRFALIRAGCSVNQQNDEGKTHLMQAVESVHINAVEELIAHGADVNIGVDNYYTALDITAGDWESDEEDCLRITQILLSAGADPNIGNPLVLAAYEERERIVEVLIEHGANINAAHRLYGMVLFIRGYKENYNIVKLALQYKAEINISQIPECEHPDPPRKANSHAVMMMFAAGEYFPFHLYDEKDIAKPIVQSRHDLSLKNIFHNAIRYYTIRSGNHENLFEAMKKVQLPTLLQNYIMYGMSLVDEDNEDEGEEGLW